ncbi:MAG: hypothetical protein K2K97_08920 [Muribaculaceae bacterium]|nr:hypothetical protein [Muribaculaceae bacterium]
MSKAALKKALKDLERDSLSEIIMELYEARPEAKEYLEFWLNPDAEEELQKYRKKIFKLFFMSEGKTRRSPAFTELKTHTKYFISLGIEPEKVSDLMLYILETYRDWLALRKHVVSHHPRFDKLYGETAAYIETAGLEDLYNIRLSRIKEETEDIFERGNTRITSRWRWRW